MHLQLQAATHAFYAFSQAYQFPSIFAAYLFFLMILFKLQPSYSICRCIYIYIYKFTLAYSVQSWCGCFVLTTSCLCFLLCVWFSLCYMCLDIFILFTFIISSCNSTNIISNLKKKGQSITLTSFRTTETLNNTSITHMIISLMYLSQFSIS